ncbi:MAG: alpha/beta hydrolase-fold protein, partial [Chloroflexota bacterium]|nr:alpha/beta hydrolase-fold protein [Chloroflexota bacterium]
YISSILELPHAPDESIIIPREGVLHGEVKEHYIHSALLNQDRRFWIYTPPGYCRDNEAYGVLFLLDGGAYVQTMATPLLLDNLLADGKIRPLVTVFVDNPGETRFPDLLCYKPFIDFLTLELMPWVHEYYHISPDPAQSLIGGASAGGLTAAYAAFCAPNIFGNVLSQSGAFWWDWDDEKKTHRNLLMRDFVQSPRKPIRFYLEVGYLERYPSINLLQINRHMRDVLEAKGYEVHYAEVGGAHEYISWRVTLANGLIALAGKQRFENAMDCMIQ